MPSTSTIKPPTRSSLLYEKQDEDYQDHDTKYDLEGCGKCAVQHRVHRIRTKGVSGDTDCLPGNTGRRGGTGY